MNDSAIIQLYWVRSEQAISATEKKYGRYCHSIAYNILRNTQDAEECTNDTWLHTWNAIPPQRPTRFKSFLGRITRNLSLNRYEKQNAQKRGSGELTLILDELAECIPSGNSLEDTAAIKDLLNRFLDILPEKSCRLFVRRYWYAASVKELAREFHMTENQVGVTLYRTREVLRSYLEKEGVTP